jgi:hypothetical protein
VTAIGVLMTDTALILNRCASFDLIREADAIVAIEVNAPVRGASLRTTRIAATERPAFDFLTSLRSATRPAGGLRIEADVAAALERAAVLVPRSDAPRAVRYACYIDHHGPPAAAARVVGTPLIVNPSLRVLQGTGAFSAAWRTSPAADAHALAWLREPGNDVQYAYWLDESDAERLGALTRGEVQPADLHIGQQRRLANAGLLMSIAQYRERTAAWARKRAYWRAHLRREAYVRLNRLLPSSLLASVQNYFGGLVAEGHLPFNDGQAPRYYRHSDPLAVWLHQQLAPSVAALVDEPVKPSYTFAGSYVAGGYLKPHTDREQCEYTLSLTVDATPSRKRADAWPLSLRDRRGQTVSARLAPGDALLFKGRELTHFRETLAPGRTSTSLFFHFVPVDFAGKLD